MKTKPNIVEDISFHHFKQSDYSTYKTWFEDEELNLQLGPIDEIWLEAALNEPNSRQYSFIQNNSLIGVLGLYLPEEESDPVFITDIAVRPDLRRHGYGTKILSFIQTSRDMSTFQRWKASVHKNNLAALGMFTRLGWKPIQQLPHSSKYIDVIFKLQA